jgi:pimeloyl-ACP methyl ester carboxylesterase
MSANELLNAPQLSRLLFYPHPHFEKIQFQPLIVDVEGAKLACFYHEVRPQGPTVVFFHGNAECTLDYVSALPPIFEIVGCNTFLAEYRGFGWSTGVPGLGHLADDCRAILDAIPTPPEQRIFFGRSLGCVPAIESIRINPNPLGLILESGAADVERAVNRLMDIEYDGTEDEDRFPFGREGRARLGDAIRERFAFRKHLAAFRRPAAVTVAMADASHRRAEADLLFHWLSEPKRLFVFEEGNHGTALIANIKTYCGIVREMAIGSFGNVAIEA